jgi:hypothetical protein
MKTFMNFFFITFLLSSIIWGINIKKISEVNLDQKETIISRGWSISVKNMDTIILVDYKDKSVKLFDKSGKYLGIWINHGFGPKETAQPYIIDYRDNKLALIDLDKNRYFIYKNSDTDKLKTLKEYITPAMGHDIKLEGNKVFISGYRIDEKGNPFGLFSINLETDKIEYLVPYYKLYGYNSFKEFIAKLNNINPIGRGCYCDAEKNFAYIVWRGNPKVIAIDLKTKKINTFSHKTDNFKMIKVTKNMLEKFEIDSKDYYLELQKFSHITGIFTDDSFIALLYANHNNKVPGWETFIQFYDPKGKFLHEEKLDGAIINDHYAIKTFYYEKEKNHLYFLSRTIDKDLNDVYKIIKYKLGQ